jgi:hypothetical protein
MIYRIGSTKMVIFKSFLYTLEVEESFKKTVVVPGIPGSLDPIYE